VRLLTLLERPLIYRFSQKLNPATVGLYRQLLTEHVASSSYGPVLDIGCGVGVHCPLFPRHTYTGIDRNPEYVEAAIRRYGNHFRVMDAGAMEFPEGSFTAVFSAATCHHLDDARIVSMVREGLRILAADGAMHIIDPVIPVSPRSGLKRAIFRHDRGRFQRTIRELTSLLATEARVTCVDVRSGMLHDVCYLRLVAPTDAS
jgi:SAM-dependent methyltransferase